MQKIYDKNPMNKEELRELKELIQDRNSGRSRETNESRRIPNSQHSEFDFQTSTLPPSFYELETVFRTTRQLEQALYHARQKLDQAKNSLIQKETYYHEQLKQEAFRRENLKEKIKELEALAKKFHAEKNQGIQKIQALENKLKVESTQHIKQHENLTLQLRSVEIEKNNAAENFKESKEKIEKLLDRIKRSNEALEQSQNENKKILEKIKNLATENQQKASEIQYLEKKYQKRIEKEEQLEKNIESKSKLASEMQEELKSLRGSHIDLQNKINLYSKELIQIHQEKKKALQEAIITKRQFISLKNSLHESHDYYEEILERVCEFKKVKQIKEFLKLKKEEILKLQKRETTPRITPPPFKHKST